MMPYDPTKSIATNEAYFVARDIDHDRRLTALEGGTPAPGPITGLLYQDAESLTGWSNPDNSWSINAAPAIIASPRSPIIAQAPGAPGSSDAGGVREGFLVLDTDGAEYISYGAGAGGDAGALGPWRPQYAKSLDNGLTWTKKGEIGGIGLTKGTGDLWPAVDNLFTEKRGSRYYLHRLTAGSVAVNQVCGQPYYSDIWSADSYEGTYTYEGQSAVAGPNGRADDRDAYASCMVLHQGVYHLFYSSTNTASQYNAGLKTGPSPTGPWTHVSAALIPPNIGLGPENPEVFWSAKLNKWVMLSNEVNQGLPNGAGTDRNRAYFSDSLTDWSAATFVDIQRICPADGAIRIGMARMKRHLSDNLPIFNALGQAGFIYDSDPGDTQATGFHTLRKLYYSQIEQSAKGYLLTAPGAGSSSGGSNASAFDDFHSYSVAQLGGQGAWVDDSGANAKPQIITNAGIKYLDMRSAVGASTVYNTSMVVPATNAKYAFKAIIGMDSGFGVSFGYDAGRTWFRVDLARRTENAFSISYYTANAGGESLLASVVDGLSVPNGTATDELQVEIIVNNGVARVVIDGVAGPDYAMPAAAVAAAGAAGKVRLRNGYAGTGTRQLRNLGIYAPAAVVDWGGIVSGPDPVASLRSQQHADIIIEFGVLPVGTGGPMEVIYRAQSAANRDNCYGVVLTFDNTAIVGTSAYKMTGGTPSTLATTDSGATVKSQANYYTRVKVVIRGSEHRVFVDNELQLAFTDTTYANGSAWGFRGGAAGSRVEVRGITARKSDTVTVNGLTTGAVVTLRGASKIPLASVTATGTSVTIPYQHYPATSIDVNGVQRHAPAAGIWGGDVYG